MGEGTVKGQSSREPRPGIPDPDVSGRQHPQPQLKFGTNYPQNTSRQGFSPPLVSLGTLMTRLLSLGSGPLWAVTLRVLSHSSGWCLTKTWPPLPPPSASQRADLILSPTMKTSCLAPLPSPSTSPFLQPWQLREGGGRSQIGNGQLRGEADTETQGWLQRGREAWEKGTEAQGDEETRDTGRTPRAATSPSCISPAPTSTYSGPGLGSFLANPPTQFGTDE